MSKTVLMAMTILALLSHPVLDARAQDTVNGVWKLVANHHHGVMQISSGSPGSYEGRLKFDGGWEPMVGLKIQGNSISFSRPRVRQRYRGTITGATITGTFDQGGAGASGGYQWRADRTSTPQSGTPPRAVELAGTWKLVANHHHGVMQISGSPGSFNGRLKLDGHGHWEPMVNLQIRGNSISFSRPRVRQLYRGTITGATITGTFDQGGAGASGGYQWRADRTGSSGSVSTSGSLTASPPRTLELAGTWKLVANNYRGVMQISGSPGSYHGRFMFDAYGRWEQMLELKIRGNSISFSRAHARQRYRGTITGATITGTFDQGGSGSYQWRADRTTGTPESGTASPPRTLGLAGTWKLVANHHHGVMEISGSPGSYQGRLKFGGGWEPMVGLKIQGNSISFSRPRVRQRYRGTITGTTITGTFDQGGAGASGGYQWRADRQH